MFERIRKYLEKLYFKLNDGPIVLIYHRVEELDFDPQLLSVTKNHFREQMEYLKKNYSILNLSDLVKCSLNETIVKNGVAITFDDGYADNLYNVKPILEELNIPATVYVTTGYVDKKYEFWWDDLERIFLLPGKLPEKLSLSIDEIDYKWDMGSDMEYAEGDYQSFSKWNVLEPYVPTQRHHIYLALCNLLRYLPTKERSELINVIVTWAGKSSDGRKSHRILSSDELRKLSERGLVEIGAHTVNHPVLAKISLEEQYEEIHQNKSALENILGHPVVSFSYPFGCESDYSSETVRIVKEAGFENACSNFPGRIKRDTDPYQIPRFLVRNWNGREFDEQLKEFYRFY